ncbi:hypothetical protein [Rubrivirga sp. IMCC45206]|uniref:hypothetical protein n=1 Tax=Rubrivirga sp. IMCC45206 TaxID=3391614 RepID=UPI003990041C
MTRRYSEEEAQRIFALVAERQRAASGVEGLSLAELEEAASAAGLDPGLVAIAAAELDTAPHPEKTMLGAPTEVVRSRVLDRPLDDDAWAAVVGAARREFGQPGMAGQIGRLREWTVISGGTKNGITTRLTVEPTERGARVTLSRSVRDTVFGLTLASAIQGAMAVFFGVMWMAGVDPELWVPAVLMAGIGTLMGAGVQIGARVWRRREGRRFDALLDRFELIALDRPTTATPAVPDGRIDPALLDTDPPDSEPARDARRDRTL